MKPNLCPLMPLFLRHRPWLECHRTHKKQFWYFRKTSSVPSCHQKWRCRGEDKDEWTHQCIKENVTCCFCYFSHDQPDLTGFQYKKTTVNTNIALRLLCYSAFPPSNFIFAVPKDNLVWAAGKTGEVEKWDLLLFHISAGWPEAVFKGIMHISFVW